MMALLLLSVVDGMDMNERCPRGQVRVIEPGIAVGGEEEDYIDARLII